MFFRANLLTFFASVLAITVYSQHNTFHQYDIRNGLAGLTVYSIIQDHEGFLWFATETGLSRFDGVNFKNFTKEDGLPDNEIIKLFVDSKNRVWILPFTNSICYYLNGKIHTQKNDAFLAKVRFEFPPYNIFEDVNGNIAVTDELNVYVLFRDNSSLRFSNINGNKFIVETVGTNIQKEFIFSLSCRGERLYEIKNNKLKVIKNLNLSTQNLRNQILLFNGNLIYKSGEFYHIQRPGIRTESKFKIPQDLGSLSYIDDTLFTLNTSDSIFLYNLNQKAITNKFFLGKTVNTCFKDKENNYWFATNGYGVYRLSSTSFRNYTFLSHDHFLAVYSIFKEKNTIYTGTNESFVWQVRIADNLTIKHSVFDMGISFGRINAILKNRDREFILGTAKGPINLKYGVKKTVLSPYNESVKCISVTGDSIIISTNGGVYQMPQFDVYKYKTIKEGRATCAYKFNDTFYIGTLSGLYLKRNTTTVNAGEKAPLLNTRISAMVQDAHGIVWIATYGNGIVCYKDGKVVRHITQEDGLVSNTCRAITFCENRVWVGTNKGINSIDTRNIESAIKSYTSKDGLNCDIINCILVENDTVYVGTPYGLTLFDPRNVETQSICNLVINSFKSEKISPDTFTNNISFPPGDKSFKIDYTAISFKSEGDITYYYKLSGIDTGWQTTRQNNIQFTTLQPGNYVLTIYAKNGFGKKSEVKKINFVVEKFFYQKTWFYVLVIAAITALVWAITWKRIQVIRKASEEQLRTQARIAELKDMALRAQMNPHFIFNCLNSIQRYIFEKNAIEANIFITNFASLIRQTLEISAKNTITLQEEVKYLNTYLSTEQSRFGNSFDFSIDVASSLSPGSVKIPPLLIQPFVENCLKHGIRNLLRTGKIDIGFYDNDNDITCIIEDNGVGREAAMKSQSEIVDYRSMGTSITQERVVDLNILGPLQITISTIDLEENGLPSGTRVVIQFKHKTAAKNYD